MAQRLSEHGERDSGSLGFCGKEPLQILRGRRLPWDDEGKATRGFGMTAAPAKQARAAPWQNNHLATGRQVGK